MTGMIHASVKLFRDTTVLNSTVHEHSSVGDFSKVSGSQLGRNVRIDRFNHIERSCIGDFSYTGRNSTILYAEIRKFCSISWNVSIGGANHDYSRVTQHSLAYQPHFGFIQNGEESYDRYSSTLKIGNDVWLGTGSIVNRGVTIGDGALIGANAVVTNDIPPYAIAIGSPARVIKYRFTDEIISALQKLKWWDWPVSKIKENFQFISDKPNLGKLEELMNEGSIQQAN